MADAPLTRAETVELSQDYELVIPPSLREKLDIRPGQKLQILVYRGRIELIPEVDPKETRGSMPDLDATSIRDEESLAGSVIAYQDPLKPVADDEWEAR